MLDSVNPDLFSLTPSQHAQPLLVTVCSSLCCRTPAPFDRALVGELFSLPTLDLDHLSVLEVISHRPNFNRVAQGWVRILPESEEL